jgi:hypothetical protein
LQVLMLAGHNFTGTLPCTWGRLANLTLLDVSHNQLTGSVPTSYSDMLQLAVLKLQENQLVASNISAASLFHIASSLVGQKGALQCLCVDGALLDTKETVKLQKLARDSAVPLAQQPSQQLVRPCTLEKLDMQLHATAQCSLATHIIPQMQLYAFSVQ